LRLFRVDGEKAAGDPSRARVPACPRGSFRIQATTFEELISKSDQEAQPPARL
jgi:hypothetical protein